MIFTLKKCFSYKLFEPPRYPPNMQNILSVTLKGVDRCCHMLCHSQASPLPSPGGGGFPPPLPWGWRSARLGMNCSSQQTTMIAGRQLLTNARLCTLTNMLSIVGHFTPFGNA